MRMVFLEAETNVLAAYRAWLRKLLTVFRGHAGRTTDDPLFTDPKLERHGSFNKLFDQYNLILDKLRHVLNDA